MRTAFINVIAGAMLALVSAATLGAPPAAGKWVENDQTYGLYHLYLYQPQQTKTQSAQPRALMVVLHGCKQTVAGDILDGRAGWESVADRYQMLVAAPDVPDTNTAGTRLVQGCWDWFGNEHQRGTRDIGLLADMINGLKGRPDLHIDADRIYMVGLSSGAALAQIFACSYPELVAGVGLHSAPALGSSVMESFGPPQVDTASIVERCRHYAGDHQDAFATQVASIMHGNEDRMVKPAHAARNRDAMRALYQAEQEAGKIEETRRSAGMLYRDANGRVRVAYILGEGLGHAFSAGDGGSGGGTFGDAFHDYTHINYPAWVTKFFFENNLRARPR